MPLPEAGTTETFTVTVEDDCGATASDIVLVGQKKETEETEETRTKEVKYENVIELQYQRGAGGPPTGSKIISGRRSDLPGVVSGKVDTPTEEQAVHDSSKWKVLADYNPGDGDPNNKTDGEYEAVQDAENAEQTKTEEVTVTKSETTTKAVTNTGITPFNNNGKTVKKDLNNDGKIDIIDWRQKYPDLAFDRGGRSIQGGPTSQSNGPTQGTNNDNGGTNNNGNNNGVEEANSDHDGDGNNHVKNAAEKDDDNNGTVEVCSNGYCMEIDTDLQNE
jgi:hypothetical protein